MSPTQIGRYWLERGKLYRYERRLDGQFYRDQEELFASVIRSLQPGSLIDVGCGFGRLTKVLAKEFPRTSFVGIDISPDQLRHARDTCSELENVRFVELDFTDKDFAPVSYNVAVFCEVLMHHPDDVVMEVLAKFSKSCDFIINDVDREWKSYDVVADHCFYHDYEEMYRKLGLVCGMSSSGPHSVVIARCR